MTETTDGDLPQSTNTDWDAEDEIDRDDDPGEQLQPGQPEVEFPPPADHFTAPRPAE